MKKSNRSTRKAVGCVGLLLMIGPLSLAGASGATHSLPGIGDVRVTHCLLSAQIGGEPSDLVCGVATLAETLRAVGASDPAAIDPALNPGLAISSLRLAGLLEIPAVPGGNIGGLPLPPLNGGNGYDTLLGVDYEHTWYGGDQLWWWGGRMCDGWTSYAVHHMPPGWNDVISSVKTGFNGCRWQNLYEHTAYNGYMTSSADWEVCGLEDYQGVDYSCPDLVDLGFNDKTSSIRINS